jgi:hypothetical protein
MTPPSVLNCTFRGRSFHQCGGRAPIGQPIGRGNGLGDILPGKRSSDGDHAPIATIAGIIMPRTPAGDASACLLRVLRVRSPLRTASLLHACFQGSGGQRPFRPCDGPVDRRGPRPDPEHHCVTGVWPKGLPTTAHLEQAMGHDSSQAMERPHRHERNRKDVMATASRPLWAS